MAFDQPVVRAGTRRHRAVDPGERLLDPFRRRLVFLSHHQSIAVLPATASRPRLTRLPCGRKDAATYRLAGAASIVRARPCGEID